MKLRWRLTLALILASILPFVPMFIAIQSTLNTGVRTLAPETQGEALRTGVELARRDYQRFERAQELRLHRIVVSAQWGDSPIPVPGLDLFEDETLYASRNEQWRVWNNGRWDPVSNDINEGVTPFETLPRSIIVEEDYGIIHWRLETSVDSTFRQNAEILRTASAQWALREQDREGLIFSLVMNYMATYLVVVILSILAGTLVIRAVSRRIEKLRDLAIKVADGNEELRTLVGTKDEIGQLSLSFNTMLDRLAKSRERAKEMEKQAAWRKLARVLAHEIKNPLTPIQLSVRQLADSYHGDDEKFAETLSLTREIVDEEVESLRRLVREFGDFARAPQIQPAEENIHDLLMELDCLYGDHLTTQDTCECTTWMIDREKIKRALINLLDNALAEVGEDGEILLRCFEREDHLQIEVEDDGPGVSDTIAPNIFEPHFTTKSTGVGLGLPIVKSTVEQHGGTITYISGRKLKGACFVIMIPRDLKRTILKEL